PICSEYGSRLVTMQLFIFSSLIVMIVGSVTGCSVAHRSEQQRMHRFKKEIMKATKMNDEKIEKMTDETIDEWKRVIPT
ncbi:hypothetical protein PMAYCL1PPCAC_04212, partial [Pristionchus mayeri]